MKIGPKLSVALIVFGLCAVNVLAASIKYGLDSKIGSALDNELLTIQDNTYVGTKNPADSDPEVVEEFRVIVTAYSSTVSQTDDTPFITASNKHVEDGIVANNLLPFGTKIRIPELYGDKIFVVEDRMNKRKSPYHVDIWLPSYTEAKNFGVANTYIEVLES